MFRKDNGDLSADKTNDYLIRNMGWALTRKRDVQLATAISKPEVFLKERQKKIDDLFAVGGEVDKVFHDTYAKYSTAGLPDDIARDYAMDHARKSYDLTMDLLEMEAPGAYSRAFGASQITRDAKDAVVNIATGGGDTWEQYKAKKLAKKAQLAIQ